MINHIRTLLLNETQASLSEAGLKYGEPWPVSGSFDKVEIPRGVLPLYRAVFYGCDTLEDRIDRVNAVMSILGAVDMGAFMGLLDTRSTVSAPGSFSIRELFDASSHGSHGFYDAVLRAAPSCTGLFSSVGSPVIDEALPKLSGMVRGSFESPIRVAAAILAMCIQLDRARRG
jgi:hypothetical protein